MPRHVPASILHRLLAALAMGGALAACDEILQDAAKPFVAEGESSAASASLADRARHQDDYLRMEAKP